MTNILYSTYVYLIYQPQRNTQRNIWHNVERNTSAMKKSTNDKGAENNAERTANLIMHEVRQPTAGFCLNIEKDTVYAPRGEQLFLQL